MVDFGRRGLENETGGGADLSLSDDCGQREPRRSRLVKVIIEHSRFGRQEAVIRNVSKSGIGGKTSCPLHVGDVITVDRAELGKFSAEIKWVRNGQFGAALAGGSQFESETLDRLQFDSHSWALPETSRAPAVVIVPRPQVSTYRPGLKSPPRS